MAVVVTVLLPSRGDEVASVTDGRERKVAALQWTSPWKEREMQCDEATCGSPPPPSARQGRGCCAGRPASGQAGGGNGCPGTQEQETQWMGGHRLESTLRVSAVQTWVQGSGEAFRESCNHSLDGEAGVGMDAPSGQGSL